MRAVLALCGVWLAVLLATHANARSPYSYGWAIFDGASARIFGAVVNPDAVTVYPVTRFFYDAAPLNFATAHNLRLPLHSFVTATAASFTRSYLAASYVANFAFLMLVAWAAVNLAKRFGVRPAPLAVALLTLFSLPLVVGFIGQPMHYIVGPAINILVVLALLGLDERDVRNPFVAGLLTAVLLLNYDWYVFGAAVVAYILFVVRFPRRRDYVLYGVVAAVPAVAWHTYLSVISRGGLSKEVQTSFAQTIANEWLTRLREPADHVLLPFVASHLGVHIGLHMIVAMIYWPLLAFALIALYRYRPELRRFRGNALILLLVACFVLEQLVTAIYDWENNPRRAIPVVLAFGWCYVWAANRTFDGRRWRAALLGLFVLSAGLAYADTLFKSPAVTFLYTGQAIRDLPKDARMAEARKLTKESMPALMEDGDILWHDLETAIVPRERLARFAFAQCFLAPLVAALFAILGRAGLLPRRAGWAVLLLWLASAVRLV